MRNINSSIKLTLIILIVVSCIFDIVTFLMSETMKFETNPIYILSGSIFALLIIKIILNCTLASFFIVVKPRSNTLAYAIILGSLYLILGQALGGYTNIITHTEYQDTKGTAIEIQPMAKEEAISSYSKIAAMLFYMPLILSLIAFKLWEMMYYGKERYKNDR